MVGCCSTPEATCQGCTNTSKMPPHTPWLSMAISSVRSTCTIVGRRVSMTLSAARHTSASPHPPPTVPLISPPRCTSIFAPTSRGTEPLRLTMVATAVVSPASICWMSSLFRSCTLLLPWYFCHLVVATPLVGVLSAYTCIIDHEDTHKGRRYWLSSPPVTTPIITDMNSYLTYFSTQ